MAEELKSGLAICPCCGTEIIAAIKSWPVSFVDRKDVLAQRFRVGVFECPECKIKFRSKVDFKEKPKETNSDITERIKKIQKEFVQVLQILRENIRVSEIEQVRLMGRIDDAKRVAESRVDVLQAEVNQLREKVKLLKQLLS